MKYSYLFFAAASLLATSAVTSCGVDNAADTANKIEFAVFSDSLVIETPDVAEAFGQPAYCVITAQGVMPGLIGYDNTETLRSEVLNAIYGTDSVANTAEGLKRLAERWLASEDSSLPLKVVDGPIMPDALMSTFSVEAKVTQLTPTILTMGIGEAGYNYGAAHGMYGVQFINFYLPDGVVLSSENLFKKGSEQQILSAIRDMASSHPQDEAINLESIEQFNNFYIEECSVVFVYNPYEIAPYASGVIKISVNGWDIFDCLTPLGRKALDVTDNF